MIKTQRENQTDEFWMREALKLAAVARDLGEVPVGAVLVDEEGRLVSSGHNLRESLNSPLGHAELLCIHRAAKNRSSWRLSGLTLYVTLEPCVMCSGALVQARVSRVVYGAVDPKGGGVKSLYSILHDTRLNHQIQVQGGVLEEEAGRLLKDFFADLRLRNRNK
jgi:tRNA(adenine34) deaminase